MSNYPDGMTQLDHDAAFPDHDDTRCDHGVLWKYTCSDCKLEAELEAEAEALDECEPEPDDEHQAEWDRYYHERQIAKDDALEIQERADGVRR